MKHFIYRHPLREQKHYRGAVVLGLAAFVFVLPMLLTVQTASAGVGPLIVDGTVRDSLLQNVSGASVTVQIKNGATVRDTQTTTTNATGFYTLSINPELWDIGNTVVVTATKGADSGDASATIDNDFGMTVNVTFGGSSIPELSTPALLGVVGATVVLVLGLGVRKRRGV